VAAWLMSNKRKCMNLFPLSDESISERIVRIMRVEDTEAEKSDRCGHATVIAAVQQPKARPESKQQHEFYSGHVTPGGRIYYERRHPQSSSGTCRQPHSCQRTVAAVLL
jgi:hypothetical protein